MIAAFADTGVKASTQLQDVDLVTISYTERVNGVPKKVKGKCVDPGAWKGQVWIFTPDGKHKMAATGTRVAK